MNRATVVEWFHQHPDLVHGDAGAIAERCERAVRRHAREDAWVLAKRYVVGRQQVWEETLGAHASEAFVAREVCQQLAQELRNHEPAPQPGDEAHLAGGGVKAALEQGAWEYLIPWIMELARDEEHETWREIVRYTKRQAQELIRSHHLSSDSTFDQMRCYGVVAAQIAGILAHDFSEHAFPRARM